MGAIKHRGHVVAAVEAVVARYEGREGYSAERFAADVSAAVVAAEERMVSPLAQRICSRRDAGWCWPAIAAHYGISERWAKRLYRSLRPDQFTPSP